MDSFASPSRPGLGAMRAAMLGDAESGSPGGYPSPKALFHDGRHALEQPGSWPRSKADDDASATLTKTVRDAAARGDFLAVERLAIKLLSLARSSNAAGIAEIAGSSPSLGATHRPELTGLSAHSRQAGVSVNFSPYITSIGRSAHGQIKADLVASGLKGAAENFSYDTANVRADATALLDLLEPFMVEASEHTGTSSPRGAPILGPGARVNVAELRYACTQ